MTLRNFAKRVLLFPFAVFRGPARQGRVALTFDDGPDPQFTLPVSRLLRQANAAGTFFLLGEKIRRHPELVQALRADGHEVASHSMSHPEIQDLPYARFESELEDVYRIVLPDGARAIGTRYLRPPKGAVTLRLIFFCVLRRIRLIFWSQDPEDYKARSAGEILDYFEAHPPRAGEIILLHDKTPHIVSALPGLLRKLEQLRLQPVTLSSLLGR